jgi:multicomponent Na+:H+ antiporter subunit A
LTALVALHALVGLAVVAFGGRLGRRALALGVAAPAATAVWLIARAPGVLDGGVVRERVSWVPALGIEVGFRLDGFALLLGLVVSVVGVLVFAYAASYLDPWQPRYGRLAGLLTLFAGAMFGLAVADDVFVLYTCWELTSITSYLLIGNDHTEARSRAAALHALLVTSAGGLAMLAGLVVLGQQAGTWSLDAILADPPRGTAASVAVVLVLAGVFTKSAQYPFHAWLPGAMAASTPVSAYLHSATMVKAGVYLLARLAPAFAVLGFWRPLVVGVGLLTMVAGGLRALRQHDLKLLLAHGTVSQLGFLVVLLGWGQPGATTAGVVLLLSHALFKAALFMVVGVLDHQTGTRDLRALPPLDRRWRPAVAVLAVSAASMAGLPPLVGFVAKEGAYDALDGLALAAAVAGSVLTAAYALRIVAGVVRPAQAPDDRPPAPPSVPFLLPAAILAAATVVLGAFPGLLDRLVGRAAAAIDGEVDGVHLALWHGFTGPLLLSAVTIGLALGVWSATARVDRVLAVGDRLPSSHGAYLWVLRRLNGVADRVTATVQNGSLPIYTGVVLLTAAGVPALALLGAAWPGWPDLVATPAHVAVGAVLVGAALSATVIRRRLSAVLFLGAVGYGMAALFVVQGAPDLALTQVAIETLSTVLFVLVLRHLPEGFERRASRSRRVMRLLVSAGVGVAVFVFALVAGGMPRSTEVSDELVARAQPEGHGRNIVNVVLVDVRALDTVGEITVLASAAIGMVALARAGRREPRSRRRATAAGSS